MEVEPNGTERLFGGENYDFLKRFTIPEMLSPLDLLLLNLLLILRFS